MMSMSAVEDIKMNLGQSADACEDPDLEDGEIDDEEDETDIRPIGDCNIAKDTQQEPIPTHSLNKSPKSTQLIANDSLNDADIMSASSKSKKLHVEDDHASSIENAIATALKKKGIEPPMPKLLESRVDTDCVEVPTHGQSRSSRRRKRKRQRDELEKDRKSKKRITMESPDCIKQASVLPPVLPSADDDDLDDYEMLNVRGGSPPSSTTLLTTLLPPQKYDSQDEDSCNSYDSYVSPHRYESRRGNKSKESRKSRRDRRGREDREERGGRNSDKRNRNDSQSDDKHRQEPRKLELCKFYLMECCAKKEKCSYMHSDFPCKYYYLGMDCVYGDQCKFSHGRPLTEQLRNILLKHLETAPKEILGSFKRICRDTAINQIATRHAELCKTFGVENTLTSMAGQNSSSSSSSRNVSTSDHHQQQHQQHTSQQPQHQQPQIPSLLDIIIKPPSLIENNLLQKDKHRKSRWCDTISQSDSFSAEQEPSSSPSLELKTMAGLVDEVIIEKLSQVGVVNLEQVNQLRFGQLAKIGLTIGEINELQINASKLGKHAEASIECKERLGGSKNSAKGDVDMRLISRLSKTCAPPAKSHTTETADIDAADCSNSNSNSSTTGVVLVDYSQYLKDSNLSFERGDLFDDEKDDEQLVIDDDLDAVEEAAVSTDKTEMEDTSVHDDVTNTANIQTQCTRNEKEIPIANKNLLSSLYNKSDNGKEQRDPRSKTDPFEPTSFIEKFTSLGSTYNNKSSPGSPDPPIYERPSMYDYDPKYADEDKKTKADRENRFNSLSITFQPAPATEVDASINSHLPIQWKLVEVDVPRHSFGAQTFTSNQTIDPRVRRILQLPELPKTNTAAALSHGRLPSTSIASPENTESTSSSSYYTPHNNAGGSSSSNAVSSIYTEQLADDLDHSNSKCTATNTSRLDPRRAASASDSNYNTKTLPSSTAQKQNVEIRNLLQKSEWYKNLSSTAKIMVNQQIALVSSELKKFHQDSTADKVFNPQIITSNPTLQQILTSLGIYIDYNGEVGYLDSDNTKQSIGGSSILTVNLNQMPPNIQKVPFIQQQQEQLQCISGKNILQSLNQTSPFVQQQQLDFLRAPPPAIPSPLTAVQYIATTAPQLKIIPPFAVGTPPPDVSRPSLLGMPPIITPVSNPFNQPFSNIVSCPPRLSLMGSPEFLNLRGAAGIHQQNMHRNFGNQRHNRNSRQNKN